MGSLQDDAKIYSLGVDLPESMDDFWATMDDSFGEPEDSRLEALKECIQTAQQSIRQYCNVMLKLSYDMNKSQMQLKQMFIAGLYNATHFQAHLSANIHTYIDLKDLAAAA